MVQSYRITIQKCHSYSYTSMEVFEKELSRELHRAIINAEILDTEIQTSIRKYEFNGRNGIEVAIEYKATSK